MCAYLLATARLTVEGWTPISSATSLIIIGFSSSIPSSRKSRLAPNNGLADFQDRLLPLLDIFHQLQRGSVLLLDVIADFLARLLIAIEHVPVLRIHPKLRNIVVVELDDIVVRILRDVNIGLDNPRTLARVSQTGPRIQMPDHIDRDLNVLHRSSELLRHLLKLPRFEQPQVVGNDLPGDTAFAVPALDLEQQALAHIASGDPAGIQRLNDLQRRLHIFDA